jgi:diadenosine tetraphosphate (Ap4A) HIT family hydrolase
MEELAAGARALAEVFSARKMNYELLGNQVAHIHWHLVPRLPEDPLPGEPAWRVEHAPLRLDPEALGRRLGLIRDELGRTP